MKSLQAQDDTYRDTANIHTKYLRHQAFQAEILSNKERLIALKKHAEKHAEKSGNQALRWLYKAVAFFMGFIKCTIWLSPSKPICR